MTLDFFKSVTDEGGAIGAQLISGTLNELFDEVSAVELLSGVTKYRKIWLQPDETKKIYSFLLDDGAYDAAIFESANPDTDVVTDLTGLERKHSPALIIATTSTTVTFAYDADMQSYVLDDVVRIDGLFNVVDSFVDNGDGTATVTVRNAISTPETYPGTFITTMIDISYTLNVASAFWMKLKIDAGSNYSTATDTLPLRNVL